MEIDSIKFGPCLGKRTRIAPVSMVMAWLSCVQAIFAAGSAAGPTEISSGPATSGVAEIECPLHMIEPSGQ